MNVWRCRQLWPSLLWRLHGALDRQRSSGGVPGLQNACGQARPRQEDGRGMSQHLSLPKHVKTLLQLDDASDDAGLAIAFGAQLCTLVHSPVK